MTKLDSPLHKGGEGQGQAAGEEMREGRVRIARRDILRGMARSRTRVRDLQKRDYPRQAYDKPQSEEE